MKIKLLLIGAMVMATCVAFGQSVAYSFGAKRADPIVSADIYPLKGTPFGNLDGIVFAGYRRDGDQGADSVPVGLGAVKRFPFGPNLSFQLGAHVVVVKGSPVDAGLLAGFAYHPTPSSSFMFGPTAKGMSLTYRWRF